jgi:hypothetical protein
MAHLDLLVGLNQRQRNTVDIGEQARAIMRRHPWLPSLLITRSVLGPNGLVLLEHALEALASHPAGHAAKLEAFAMLNAAPYALAGW